MTAGFSGPLLRAGPAAQAPLLRQLAHALDRVAHLDLAGVRLMLGGEYGVDSLGQLWLDAADSALSWAGCAMGSYPPYCSNLWNWVCVDDGSFSLPCALRLLLHSFWQAATFLSMVLCRCSSAEGAAAPAMGSYR